MATNDGPRSIVGLDFQGGGGRRFSMSYLPNLTALRSMPSYHGYLKIVTPQLRPASKSPKIRSELIVSSFVQRCRRRAVSPQRRIGFVARFAASVTQHTFFVACADSALLCAAI
jgi:hypothetical protein